MSEVVAARLLYDLYLLEPTSADVLGYEICALDEYFEPHMPGEDQGRWVVRKFLERFANDARADLY